jgi:hypothetical protein
MVFSPVALFDVVHVTTPNLELSTCLTSIFGVSHLGVF